MNYPTSQSSKGGDDSRTDKIPHYQREWLASGASPETIDLNVFWSLDWEVDEDNINPGMDRFLSNSPGLTVYNNKRYSTPTLRQWGFLEDGYWGVNGLDPLNIWQAMDWFQAKPVNPPKYYEIKNSKGFEPSEKAPPEYVDKYTWNKVARHFGLSTMAEPHMLHPAGFWDWVEQNGLTDKFYLKEQSKKYVSPPKVPTRATFLRISNNQSARHFGEELPSGVDGAAEATGHWQRCLDENSPIVILEDAGKKSGCIINHVPGVMPIGLPGICGGVRSQKDNHGQLVPGGEKSLIAELEVFATSGRTVYICFDQDKKFSTQRHVNREREKLGRLYERSSCNIHVVIWPQDWGKGIDDVWTNGHNIQRLFDEAIPFGEFLLSYANKPWTKFEPDPLEYRRHVIRWDIEEEILTDLEEQRRQEECGQTTQTIRKWEKSDFLKYRALIAEGKEQEVIADLERKQQEVDSTAQSAQNQKASKWKEPNPTEYQSCIAKEKEEELIEELEERRRQEEYPTAWEVWKKSRSLTALPEQTVSQQWISFNLPPVGTGLGVKSAMGTGKTEQIKNILAQAGKEARLFFIAPTNTLNHQACKRLGLKHLQTELGERDYWEVMDEIGAPGARFALCPDSLIHFKNARFRHYELTYPELNQNTIIVLDEARTIADVLLFGKTAIKRNRQEIITITKELLTKSGRAIALDGTLNDNVIVALEKMSSKRINILANTYKKPITYNMFVPTDNSNDYGGMIQKIELHASAGRRLILGSDSQHFCETIDLKLQKMGLHGQRLDSKTSREGWAKAFFEDPNKWIEANQLDYFVFSPSACQGFDISIEKYFEFFYIMLFGVLTTDDQAQIATRVRDPDVTRFVYCPNKGIKHSNISYAVLPEHVIEDLRQYQVNSWLKTFAENKHPGELLEILGKAQASPLYELRGKRIAQENFERDHLRDCLKYALNEQGQVHCHDMAEYEPEEFKELKEEIKQQNCEFILNAPDLTEDEAEGIRSTASQNGGLSFAHKCALKKFDIKNRLPGIEKSESWDINLVYKLEYDDKNLIRKRSNFYLLKHADDAFMRDWLWWYKEMERLEDDPERTLDMSATHRYPMVETLMRSGINKILSGEISIWSSRSEIVSQINHRVRSRAGQQNLLKKFGQMTPMACVNEIMRNLLGLELKHKKVAIPAAQKGGKRTFIREYRIVPDERRRECQMLADIDTAVAKKFEQSRPELQAKMKELRKQAEIFVRYESSRGVAPSPENDISKSEGATTTEIRIGAGVQWAINLFKSMMSSLKEGQGLKDLDRALVEYRKFGSPAVSQAEQLIEDFDDLILQAFDAQDGLRLLLSPG